MNRERRRIPRVGRCQAGAASVESQLPFGRYLKTLEAPGLGTVLGQKCMRYQGDASGQTVRGQEDGLPDQFRMVDPRRHLQAVWCSGARRGAVRTRQADLKAFPRFETTGPQKRQDFWSGGFNNVGALQQPQVALRTPGIAAISGPICMKNSTPRPPRPDTRLATYFTPTSRPPKSLAVDPRSGGLFDRAGYLQGGL
jgi:hypothetical protein